MATKRIIEDSDFERIIIRTHKLARNISMRVKNDGLHVTIPPYTTTKKVLDVIKDYRSKLLYNWNSVKPKPIDYDYVISAPCFKLKLEKGSRDYFSVKIEDEKTIIFCPKNVDFTLEGTQKLLKNAIVRAMKRRAAEFLPPMLSELSKMHNLPFKRVKINGSKGRWGSCSSTKSINLSCYLMLLPPHLMDYVMLHELAHTKEMNHGPEFWNLLEELTGETALILRTELRKFSIHQYQL